MRLQINGTPYFQQAPATPQLPLMPAGAPAAPQQYGGLLSSVFPNLFKKPAQTQGGVIMQRPADIQNLVSMLSAPQGAVPGNAGGQFGGLLAGLFGNRGGGQ